MSPDQPSPTDAPALPDMDPESFRQYGHEVVDWIAAYLGNPERYPVLAQVRPGEVKAGLPSQHPDDPAPMSRILEDFEQVILPGITHWNHPSFFAYFGITASAPGILGELLSAALNVNGMLWKTAPAATELEELSLDWLRQMLGLPEELHGIIMDTASMASLVAIAAAREALDLDIRRKGMAGRHDLPRLRLYTSEQAHASIEKGAIALGIGQENVRKIPADDDFRMVPQALQEASEEDVTNYMDWGVQLGRRFRALKLWMVIRYFGHEGLAARIRYHLELARQFCTWVDSSPVFERLAPTPFSTICFRAHPQGIDDEAALDRLNAEIMEAANETGRIYVSHTRLKGKFALRLAIGNLRTTEKHVADAWQLLQEQAMDLAGRITS